MINLRFNLYSRAQIQTFYVEWSSYGTVILSINLHILHPLKHPSLIQKLLFRHLKVLIKVY